MVSAFVMAPPATFLGRLASVVVISSADVVVLELALGVAVGAALLVRHFVGASRARHALRAVTRASHTPARSAA
jgi:hypothetical protein